jgi:alpha,alpha-trehalose-phosphate synthase [UDP-forming]
VQKSTSIMKTIFVSNRLPIIADKARNGWRSHTSAGGLVSALAPLLRRFDGNWIGWTGAPELQGRDLDNLVADFIKREGYRITPVPLSRDDYHRFYQGYCNEIIWPLFHDLQSHCNFQPAYWSSAQKVEHTFADVVARHAQPDDRIWVQDYHLLGLGRVLREQGLTNPLAYFLHIPFPAPDIFCKLPWRDQVIKGLFNYGLIGLQTRHDLRNFADCVDRLLPEATQFRSQTEVRLRWENLSCTAGAFPIGIDFEEFGTAADTPAVEQRMEELRRDFSTRQIVLGVDRLDYTKGIPDRLKAFKLALERYPDLHGKVILLQVVIPSREDLPAYQRLKTEIEQLVAAINGQFTQPGWVPVHYIFRSIERQELLAWYRLADVALLTPLKDGMNLVSKEYCACQIEGNGVLVLSEFAGAAEQMAGSAILVNPYDMDALVAAIRKAVYMSPEARRPAMDRLRASTRDENVYWWGDRFISRWDAAIKMEPQLTA